MGHVYHLTKGVLYAPDMKKAKGGFYIGCSPITVVEVAETDELRKVLRETLAKSIPIIPTPPMDGSYSNLLELTGKRSWRAFVKASDGWNVRNNDDIWEIVPMLPKGSGRVPDTTNTVPFAPGTSSDEVAERFLAMVQDKARERGEL